MYQNVPDLFKHKTRVNDSNYSVNRGNLEYHTIWLVYFKALGTHHHLFMIYSDFFKRGQSSIVEVHGMSCDSVTFLLSWITYIFYAVRQMSSFWQNLHNFQHNITFNCISRARGSDSTPIIQKLNEITCIFGTNLACSRQKLI